MATLVLGLAGQAIGASIGGGILGVSAATIGGLIGPGQHSEGPRLESLKITTSTEGIAIPRIFGRMRVGGNIIWATDFTEHVNTEGGKGLGSKNTSTTYTYSASFAVALCEGEITGIGRIWADGELLDTSSITWRWYPGSETQSADTFIATVNGSNPTPAYRGTAYVVFEDLPLADFGNRIPQLTFEVFRPLDDNDTAEGAIKAVTMIPGAGEFVYATEPVTRGGSSSSGSWPSGTSGAMSDGSTVASENVHAETDRADMLVSLDRLEALVPSVESVSLVVSWFGNDLRCGDCLIKPGVEAASKTTSPLTWTVDGVDRAGAHQISTDSSGNPVFGGTPDDASVVQAIKEIKARGLRVTFYPFILMDVPEGNTLPNPYSDNAATAGQPKLPWRGRITCSPAAGYVGTVDKTATAASQVSSFFGNADAADFTVSGETVSWSGGTDWGYRRMILHYAHLCAAAGGVDSFLIGSELVGLTTVREDASTYPTVAALKQLAADVSAILGAGTEVGYAADWSEYFGHQPADGSGDVFFHLDALWADSNIDFVGIDNYLPLSDWRDGFDHLDAQAGYRAVHDRAYLQANIEGGERFDWYYASDADRASQTRTTISDGAYSKPWVYRPKDIRSWWLSQHYDRPAGVEAASPTAWAPQSKPIRFTEFGCPAIDRGTNQPNVFYDPKSSESALPHFSRGWRDDAIQRAYLEAVALYWADASNNPTSSVYGGPMVDMSESAAWTWDARPHPFFPALDDVWADAANWQYGHWLTGRLGAVSLAALVRHLCIAAGMSSSEVDTSGLYGAVEGYVITSLQAPRAAIEELARFFAFDMAEIEGKLVFSMRGGGASRTFAEADLLRGEDERRSFELGRAQENELPEALKWQVVRADEEYDAAQVEARRRIVASARIEATSLPFVVAPEEAERQCVRALAERWLEMETARFALPPSELALDAGDVIGLINDGRTLTYRITRVTDGAGRQVEAVRHERETYDLPPGAPRPSRPDQPTTTPSPLFGVMNLPQLNGEHVAHRPIAALWSSPWPGLEEVWRGPDANDLTLLTTATRRAFIGTLAADLPSGPVAIFDNGTEMLIDLFEGSVESVSDSALFAGANTFAVEIATDQWEIIQAANATLVSTGRYKLTRLLRGQRGTDALMVANVSAGARVVMLNDNVLELPTDLADVGLTFTWHARPSGADAAGGTTLSQTITGRGLVPFAPVWLAAAQASGSNDLTLSWIRRDRDPSADSWDMDVPMSETTESQGADP